ncbi:aminoglycoside 3-N-acetyltransferase [Dongia sedimenti]|uniref:Aminoglycoside N(3)-acetyltransferase n=1 Tax=Dongia sedimenti TaxID=3064282 RepID=A0ABU0YV00_9PROT|nr:aminoglycoside 3-N-acetyltransferase [Rhodospirillaceae bacterium R-7]
MQHPAFITTAQLTADLARLGVAPGDLVMVHAACNRVGPVLGGPDAIIAALREAMGAAGTLMAYLDWEADWENLVDAQGRTLPEWRPHVLPFDPARTRAARQNGVLPEFLRTTPGALRSGNPGASVTALGAKAEWLTADHPLDYGYGPGTPLARLVEARGKVLMLGAPRDTMTLLHHAEHLAMLPDKRIIRVEVPFATPTGTAWRWIEEFDTSHPCVAGLPEDFIDRIVTDYLATGAGRQGRVGLAQSVLVEAADILPFAVAWMERVAG